MSKLQKAISTKWTPSTKKHFSFLLTQKSIKIPALQKEFTTPKHFCTLGLLQKPWTQQRWWVQNGRCKMLCMGLGSFLSVGVISSGMSRECLFILFYVSGVCSHCSDWSYRCRTNLSEQGTPSNYEIDVACGRTWQKLLVPMPQKS